MRDEHKRMCVECGCSLPIICNSCATTTKLIQNARELRKCLVAALDYIAKCPCDPDIFDDQLAAHLKLQDLNPKEVIAATQYLVQVAPVGDTL